MAVHFVGFKNEFDRKFQRAKFGGEFDPDSDVFVFAKGTERDDVTPFTFDDSATV